LDFYQTGGHFGPTKAISPCQRTLLPSHIFFEWKNYVVGCGGTEQRVDEKGRRRL
jgi:hypothetical protein